MTESVLSLTSRPEIYAQDENRIVGEDNFQNLNSNGRLMLP